MFREVEIARSVVHAPAVSAVTLRQLPWRCVAITTFAALIFAFGVLTITARSTNGFAVYSDGVAYFLYARSAVIDHDLYIGDEFEQLDRSVGAGTKALEPLRKWTSRGVDGKLISPWPAGAGLMLAPFYAVGYAIESAVAAQAHRPADSYGLIPQMAFALGSVLFGVVGFWCMWLLTLQITETRVAYLTSMGIALSGPVAFYTLFHPSMAHALSFGLVSMLTCLWLRVWNRELSRAAMVWLGLLLGLAATVRYQNALYGALLVALVVKEWTRAGLPAAAKHAITGMVASLLPVVMLLRGQLTLASSSSGLSVAQYPIDFTSPYFMQVLLSCRHGAFHWAPLLGVAAFGLLWAAARREGWAIALLIVLVLNTYLIGGLSMAQAAYHGQPLPAGWLHHWDDAPSFGMRYLTECAPLFAVGLAYLIRTTIPLPPFRLWAVGVGLGAVWNALLIAAYGLETITRAGCLSYSDMLNGFAELLAKLFQHLS
jgi:hypothetical protein